MPAGDFPIVEIFEYDTAEIADPGGLRHIAGGSFAFRQKVSLGCSVATPGVQSTSGVLRFESLRFDSGNLTSHIESKVTAITFHLAASGTAISNMRLYIVDNTALMAGPGDTGTEPARLQFAVSGIWQPNSTLPSGITGELPTSVPSDSNVARQDGTPTLFNTDDRNASQYVYMNVLVPLGFPLGTFGVCGSGLLRLGLVFDYYSDEYIFEFGEPGT